VKGNAISNNCSRMSRTSQWCTSWPSATLGNKFKEGNRNYLLRIFPSTE